MTTGGNRLFIGAKGKEDPRVGFDQIERWANAIKITPLKYSAGWSDFGGGDLPGGYFIDPFGIVHLTGAILFTGNIAAGAVSNVCQLPPACGPGPVQFVTGFSIPIVPIYVRVLTAAGLVFLQASPSVNVTNPGFSLEGFTYPVFK